MKNSISQISLLIALTAGLTACGGGGSSSTGSGGGSTVSTYNGTWNSSSCEIAGTNSYKQSWKIMGGSLENKVTAWLGSTTCAGTPKSVEVNANLDYKDEVDVANTCADGKAQQVDVNYSSIKTGSTTITGEQNIQNILASQGISNALPKYGLICKGSDGKLYRGLTTTDKDASTAAKRPTEMDTTNPLVP